MATRIRPASPEQWGEQTRAILGGATPAADARDGQGPPNILYTIAHHPRLLQPFLGFTATLAMGGVLPRRDSELLALRASFNCRSAFEWGHHVEYAEAEGVTEEEIGAIASGPDHPSWSPADRLLLRAADELHARQTLTDDTFRSLSETLEDAQIVELVFVVGNYTMLSMVANATGVPLERRLPPRPERERR